MAVLRGGPSINLYIEEYDAAVSQSCPLHLGGADYQTTVNFDFMLTIAKTTT